MPRRNLRRAAWAAGWLAASLALSMVTHADPVDHHLRVCGSAGVAHTWFSPSDGTSRTYRALENLSLAVTVARPQTRASSIEAGLVLEGRGGTWFSKTTPDGRFLGSGGEAGFKRQLDLAYVSIPIRIRIAFASGAWVPSIAAGAEIGTMPWARQVITVRSTGARYDVDDGVRSRELRPWELAGTVGGRLATPWAGRRLFIDMAYVHGISSINGSKFVPAWGEPVPPIVNRVLRVSLGSSL